MSDDALIRAFDGKMGSSHNRQKAINWMRLPRDEKLKKIKKYLILKEKNKPKNWCHLPPEIKLEVIKSLDFPARLKLRMTASEERDLVDSLKINFKSVSFRSNHDERWGEIAVEYPTYPGK